ncbi:hypothetical protein GCM10025859_57710 [Alicyclobacillus fastidiosus]|nr:hypothetical protein GCM10025859_57710 [Alicyclobacillus fastidiosus]
MGHISPEASEGGLIGLIEDGDRISIDLKARSIHLDVPDDVLAARKESYVPPDKAVERGYLRRYQHLVTSANTGAVLKV